MSYTLEQAQNMLNQWLAAETAVSTGQSYRIGTRQLSRANLTEISKRIEYWRAEINKIKSGRRSGVRVARFIPRDL